MIWPLGFGIWSFPSGGRFAAQADGRYIVAEFIAGLFNTSRYKRSQGKIARQATLAVLAVAIVIGAWRLNVYMANSTSMVEGKRWVYVSWVYLLPLAVLLVGLWASFRLVNIPKFADFLISVEAEMNKVSWPGREELFRASMVVIVVIFFLAAVLFGYDIALKFLLGKVFGLGG